MNKGDNTLEKKKISNFKKLEKQFFWGFIVMWAIVSGPGFFNYLHNSIDPRNIFDSKSHKGAASIQYIGSAGKTKIKTLVVGEKYFECGTALPQSTKGCDGIPPEYFRSELTVDYISIPWIASRVSNDYPIKVKSEASGNSVVLIEDKSEFLKDLLYFDVESSIYVSIAIVFIFFCTIKFIRHVERTQS